MCCLLEELSKYKQIRKCNVASFEKEKNQLRKCEVASCKKNATQKMQRWKLHFFAFSVAFVLVPLHFFFAFFRFFRKKNTKVDQSCKKIQRRKCNVASCKKKCNGENATLEVACFLHFPFVIFGICIFVAFLDFPDLLQLALWFCLEFSRQRMLLIEGGTATSLGAKDTSLRNCLAHCMSPFLLGNFKIRDVKLDKIVAFWGCIFLVFFPTCQVRVVRFCQSCSPPPPRLAVLLLLPL